MEELIAKRYIKALKTGSDVSTMESYVTIFSALADSFTDSKFNQIMNSPDVSKDVKTDILLEAVKPADSTEVNNLIKLLAEQNRINIIPVISVALNKDLANTQKSFSGIVYSDSEIDANVMQDLSNGLSKKFDSTIALSFVKSDFNGIKVDVADLGVEINFSKSRINNQMIEHILKAI